MFFGCCILRSGKEREEVEEKLKRITGKLIREHSLEEEEYRYLIDHREEVRDRLAREARRVTEQIYGEATKTWSGTGSQRSRFWTAAQRAMNWDTGPSCSRAEKTDISPTKCWCR